MPRHSTFERARWTLRDWCAMQDALLAEAGMSSKCDPEFQAKFTADAGRALTPPLTADQYLNRVIAPELAKFFENRARPNTADTP